MVGSAVAFDEMAPSIAVIPFASRNLANDQGVVGEILAEEVIRRLSHASAPEARVALSTTAFSGRDASPEEIGAHLRADYVLSGAYRAANSRFKLDVELAEARSGRILWVESLEDDLSTVMSGEQELIGRLIAGVSAAVTTRELQRSRTQPLPTSRPTPC